MLHTTPPDPAALARLDAWRGTAPLTDARLAAYLGAIFEAGRATATAALAVADVRYLKNGGAKAIRTVRATGIEARLTAHSGRVGLASELTARGASTTEVMLAGNWKTARMVAHYQKIVVALNETISIMAEVDDVIEAHGGWPDAFQTASEADAASV